MKITEQAYALIRDGEIKEMSTDLFKDSIDAILGNPVSVGKIIFTIARSPFFIRERLFWTRLESFLDGVYLDDDDRGKLRAKLMEVGEEDESILRLIQCIDRVETQKKFAIWLMLLDACLWILLISLRIFEFAMRLQIR